MNSNKVDTWSSLLDSVASGKCLPDKRLLVLGGSTQTQKDFLEVLASDSPKNMPDRKKKRPPIANDFALGYTYQDVLEADHEDSLARLSIYTLQNLTSGFASLLKPLLSPTTIPGTVLVILLDWYEPWKWVRQIRDWIRLLHDALSSLDDSSKERMQEVMQDWEQRRRGGLHDIGGTNSNTESSASVPLGPGEWDEALGLPLCVVCHNCDQIDALEREHGWREEDFDYILQFLRTILLKHGASLIYTSNSMPNSLPLLVQYTLGIHSTLKRQTLRHNVVDRDKILIPPNWDSWGKIRILREGFDVETISEKWGPEIQPLQAESNGSSGPEASVTQGGINEDADAEISPLFRYEKTIKDPATGKSTIDASITSTELEVETMAMQEFLAKQSEAIERLKAEEEQTGIKDSSKAGVGESELSAESQLTIEESSRVKEHIGPIQFNMGGIQVDAEDMLNHIKERTGTEHKPDSPQKDKDMGLSNIPRELGKPREDALANFFAGLIKKSGGAPHTPPQKDKPKP